MKVKAKRNVQDASGWHRPGEVFLTEKDLGDAVEVLEGPAPKEEPEVPAKTEEEPKAAKPKAARRKKAAE